jgi:hypothetical protein
MCMHADILYSFTLVPLGVKDGKYSELYLANPTNHSFLGSLRIGLPGFDAAGM